MLDLKLENHNLNELALATTIQDGICYVDGVQVTTLSDRLYKARDILPVDVFNALFERDLQAQKLVDERAKLVQF